MHAGGGSDKGNTACCSMAGIGAAGRATGAALTPAHDALGSLHALQREPHSAGVEEGGAGSLGSMNGGPPWFQGSAGVT